MNATEFFSDEWWDRVLDAWSRSADRSALAALGVVRFEMTEPAAAVWIRWDDQGVGSRVPGGDRSAPTFAAAEAEWRAFMAGERDAMASVLTRRIRFVGSLPRILPYVRGFDALATIARGA